MDQFSPVDAHTAGQHPRQDDPSGCPVPTETLRTQGREEKWLWWNLSLLAEWAESEVGADRGRQAGAEVRKSRKVLCLCGRVWAGRDRSEEKGSHLRDSQPDELSSDPLRWQQMWLQLSPFPLWETAQSPTLFSFDCPAATSVFLEAENLQGTRKQKRQTRKETRWRHSGSRSFPFWPLVPRGLSQAPKWTILPASLGKWTFNHPDARALLVLSVPGTERRQDALHRVLVTW